MQILNNNNYDIVANNFELKDNENIISDFNFKKQDSLNSVNNEEMNIEIENFKKNHFRAMNEDIDKLKEFNMNEIQSFESNN